MSNLLLLVMITFFANLALANPAEEAVVIEIRKKIKLHDTERIYADYFIKGGSRLGLDEGVIVSVVRRIPVHDPFDNASVGDFHVKVADIEIIQSDAKKAIGRLVQIDRRKARPMLAYDAVMIGDRLDLDTLRRKVSEVEMPSSVFETRRQPAAAPMVQPTAPMAPPAAPAISPSVELPEPSKNSNLY